MQSNPPKLPEATGQRIKFSGVIVKYQNNGSCAFIFYKIVFGNTNQYLLPVCTCLEETQINISKAKLQFTLKPKRPNNFFYKYSCLWKVSFESTAIRLHRVFVAAVSEVSTYYTVCKSR